MMTALVRLDLRNPQLLKVFWLAAITRTVMGSGGETPVHLRTWASDTNLVERVMSGDSSDLQPRVYNGAQVSQPIPFMASIQLVRNP